MLFSQQKESVPAKNLKSSKFIIQGHTLISVLASILKNLQTKLVLIVIPLVQLKWRTVEHSSRNRSNPPPYPTAIHCTRYPEGKIC